jgi:teichuronic acid biosynthesis glycosyltransferase TuaG
MKKKVDISVIIPMYNAEKYIEGAINSVLQQKDHHFEYEIIVVDDKSTDNSIEIVKIN